MRSYVVVVHIHMAIHTVVNYRIFDLLDWRWNQDFHLITICRGETLRGQNYRIMAKWSQYFGIKTKPKPLVSWSAFCLRQSEKVGYEFQRQKLKAEADAEVSVRSRGQLFGHGQLKWRQKLAWSRGQGQDTRPSRHVFHERWSRHVEIWRLKSEVLAKIFWPRGHIGIKIFTKVKIGIFVEARNSKSRLRSALQFRGWGQYFGFKAKLWQNLWSWGWDKSQKVRHKSRQDRNRDLDAKAWNLLKPNPKLKPVLQPKIWRKLRPVPSWDQHLGSMAEAEDKILASRWSLTPLAEAIRMTPMQRPEFSVWGSVTSRH